MIEKTWEEECVLTINHRLDKGDGSTLTLFWNGDTPENSKVTAEGQEIFLHVKNDSVPNRTVSSFTSLSIEEAKALKDTLGHMINQLSE